MIEIIAIWITTITITQLHKTIAVRITMILTSGTIAIWITVIIKNKDSEFYY